MKPFEKERVLLKNTTNLQKELIKEIEKIIRDLAGYNNVVINSEVIKGMLLGIKINAIMQQIEGSTKGRDIESRFFITLLSMLKEREDRIEQAVDKSKT